MRAFLKMSLPAVCFVLASFGVSTVAQADVYKCKDAQGKFSYTDSPCVGRSKMMAYSKVTAHNHKFKLEQAAQVKQFKAERLAESRRNGELRSNANASVTN